ncbi:hypothetical protein VNO80_07287 [Phaseolus coccineus]|uniref:Uncharacterized protein n=1 Tax=Phaseolus coccineus TaxID=3886 RepID=A0AAN9NN63_PHACN
MHRVIRSLNSIKPFDFTHLTTLGTGVPYLVLFFTEVAYLIPPFPITHATALVEEPSTTIGSLQPSAAMEAWLVMGSQGLRLDSSDSHDAPLSFPAVAVAKLLPGIRDWHCH